MVLQQQALSQKSAESNAQEASDALSKDAERLAKAEAAMTTMLQRVNTETRQVEKAASDLRQAQTELDKDPVVELRNAGIPKQAALVGLLLFSFRSIGDAIVATLNTDETLLVGALIQGGIALCCAAIFFLL